MKEKKQESKKFVYLILETEKYSPDSITEEVFTTRSRAQGKANKMNKDPSKWEGLTYIVKELELKV